MLTNIVEKIKSAYQKTKKWLFWALVGGTAIAASIPFTADTEIDLRWVCSYESALFDTPSGDMEAGYYSLSPNGKEYYYRDLQHSADVSQFQSEEVGKFDATGLTEAHIIGRAYYNEFDRETGNSCGGKVVRERSDATVYWNGATVKDYPKPQKKIPTLELQRLEANAAVAFDAATDGGVCVGCSSQTFAHTVTGTNPIILVGVRTSNSGDVVTGITYNTVALTRIATIATDAGNVRSFLYDLVAPATGSNNVVVSLSLSANIRSTASSYTGANQSGQPDNFATNKTDSATSFAGTVTPVADGSWVVAHFDSGGPLAPTAGSGTVNRAANGNSVIADNNASVSPPAATSLNEDVGVATEFAVVIASIAPVAAAGGDPDNQDGNNILLIIYNWVKPKIAKANGL